MPSISKIRLTNVIYEEGNKRYNDELFLFDGYNGAILLENGGGKTVLIQTALQAILPHVDLADRKIKDTLVLENAPAHIAIEWITNDEPRQYVVTAVSLFMNKHGLDSLRYVYEYTANDPNGIEGIPFVRDGKGGKRTAERGEMVDYYGGMKEKSFHAKTFSTIKEYKGFLEEQYHIISSEWESVVKINSTEGGVEAFFDDCKNTNQLFDRLLIPTVESSIAGHDATMFADMFEKQHTSFKNYKKLKETIEENKRIQQQLEEYVRTYEGLHKKEQVYEKTKERTKGIWLETLREKESTERERDNIVQELERWKTSNYQYKMKKASLDIQLEKEKLIALQKDHEQVVIARGVKEEELLEKQKHYYSLKYGELKEALKEHQDRLAHVEQEMEKLDQTEELDQLNDQLEEAKAQLLGFFLEEKEGLEKEKQGLIYERNPVERELANLLQVEQEVKGKKEASEKTLSEVQGRIRMRTSDMKDLAKKLLTNPLEENVQVEYGKWTERNGQLERELIQLKEEEQRLVQRKLEAEGKKETLQGEFTRVEKEKNQLDFQLSEVGNRERELILKLASVRPQWSSLDSVYFQQNSIMTKILEMIEKLDKERSTLLYKERLAYRFVDDHGNQEQFFGDAFVEQQLHTWKNQLDYVVTGVEYLQSLAPSEQERKKTYPLWPLTLITTAKSKGKLQEKLFQVTDRLQFPVVVLTTEEAAAVSENGDEGYSWIAPKHWGENSDPVFFQEWKERIGDLARETTTKREEKEAERNQWEQIQNEFDSFFQYYPYEKIKEWEEAQREKTNVVNDVLSSIDRLKEEIVEIEMAISSNGQMYKQAHEEKQGLLRKMQDGEQYLQYEQEVKREEERKEEIQQRLEGLKRELTGLVKEIGDFEEQKKDLDGRIQTLSFQIQQLLAEEDYQDVKDLQPIFTGESKRVIKERIRDIDYKINGINRTHRELKVKHDAARENIASTEKQMRALLSEHGEIDVELPFPSDGKQEMELVWAKLLSLKDVVKELGTEVEKKATLMNTQKGKVENKVERFREDFSEEEVLEFAGLELKEVSEELKLEKERLKEKKKFITEEEARVTQELRSIGEAERGLDRHSELHHFDAPHIKGQLLLHEEISMFKENRKGFVAKVTKELQENREAVDAEKVQVERAKRRFREFCNGAITDVKMRNMALNGVEQKESYDDIVTFKKNMMVSVERATSYANEHIRQKDAELQSFINHIHSHLETIVEELKQIPKKTKVKVGDDWKQIFTFSIPEWEPEEGKARIRDYMEWILQQLESERFLNDQGVQDDAKIRKEIESWLHSKQLLQMIMNNEVMKVSCRKVTNDNKVTTRSYSWEQSNVWSGGEKWSKNMTLFFGILNYVAEKKQHIQPKMKRHRAVILDNPFGKASSDHVLNPVFFVAEQLGFQIIALTAHAEGKFLQDFFPIIYSCRLRGAAGLSGAGAASGSGSGAGKQVMTKEKWLHHAYFQDHEPKTIDRLGETEQMTLF
ncbi:hypothetical protein J2S74_000785 [Evansella vedderi]|uniref:Chromosome segregation ATPase n=1 Tax=Evansella vedderi TaxID=38282 RepID=A0ABT9ZQ98_9BACI|nr:hypothetical protein [Evansella vedderi]MDQ0253413.1 hypothetical protein [Evansella vedderi]